MVQCQQGIKQIHDDTPRNPQTRFIHPIKSNIPNSGAFEVVLLKMPHGVHKETGQLKKIKGIRSPQSTGLLRRPFLSHRPGACHCSPDNCGEQHAESARSAPGCVLHRGRAPRVIEQDRKTLPTNLCADFLAT